MTPIAEIADVVSGSTPKTGVPEFWGGDVQWATPADLSRLEGGFIASTPRTLTQAGLDSCGAKLLPTGSVLLSSRAPIGHLAINTVPMATNQGFKSLVPNERADARYLYHYLRSRVDYLQSLGNGATFKELSKRTVDQIEIPLFSIGDQRRIAAILDQADALRAKRRQVLAHLDALTQSIFDEMFGQSAHWATESLGSLSSRIDNGTSPVCEARPALPGEWGVLKLGAVTYGEFRAWENKAYLADVASMSGNEVLPGDVLMTRKNTKELVGAVAIVEDDVRPRLLLPDLVFRLHLDRDRVEAVYFQAFMMTPRIRLAVRTLSSGSAASMPNISKARLRSLQIELPPMELQREFARRINHVSRQKASTQRALAESDTLFASGQSRAFRGEL